MIGKIDNLIPKTIRTELKILKKICINYGHLKSVKKSMSIDRHDKPIPWYTYPSIEFLKQFDYSQKVIFEWGSGNSSLFWAKLAKYVYSVEDNQAWFNNINSDNKNNNMKLYFKTNAEEYVNIISEFGFNFDVIVIDASHRQKCADIAGKFLNDGGLIIFDNSDRYPQTCKKLRETNDLIQVDFSGFSPINDYTHTTSLFFDRKFNFKPEGNQPVHSLGSLKEICE
jgi:hypothetical protein